MTEGAPGCEDVVLTNFRGLEALGLPEADSDIGKVSGALRSLVITSGRLVQPDTSGGSPVGVVRRGAFGSSRVVWFSPFLGVLIGTPLRRGTSQRKGQLPRSTEKDGEPGSRPESPPSRAN